VNPGFARFSSCQILRFPQWKPPTATPITADAADALSSVRREKLICFSLESYWS
jgi:hypothetical protein